ncbi:MAG: hypothetical protein WD896_01240 [Parcubacteria group bacterium]
MIIDIGSGHKPHKQANILLEYKEDGDKHKLKKDKNGRYFVPGHRILELAKKFNN